MREQLLVASQDGVVQTEAALEATNSATSRVTQPAFWDKLPARWDSDVDDELVCCQVRQETHDVKTFVFRAPADRAFVFEPGQFITLELEIAGESVNRCYTISSSPTRPHTLAITVKRVPGGAVSNWLHDNLNVGGVVRALGPAGEFTCARHPARKFLFLSAGSGVTPLMSMSRAHYDLGEDRDIVFVHSARTPDDIVFERELSLIAAEQTAFRTAFVCERRGARNAWHGVTGFLSLALLKLIAPDYLEREVFVCGPAPYMKAVRDLLAEGGFDRQHYHEESFSFDTVVELASQLATAHVGDALSAGSTLSAAVTSSEAVSAIASSTAPEAALANFEQSRDSAAGFAPTGEVAFPLTSEAPVDTTYTVSFAKSRRDISCHSQQNVLDAAKKAGVRVPASCMQGMCGTCKVKLISGEVEMKHAGGIRQREIDQGMVLLCCSKPKTDLVVDK